MICSECGAEEHVYGLPAGPGTSGWFKHWCSRQGREVFREADSWRDVEELAQAKASSEAGAR